MLIPYVLNFRLFIINNFPDLVKLYGREAIRICDVLQARSKIWLSFALSGHEYAVVLSGLLRSRKKELESLGDEHYRHSLRTKGSTIGSERMYRPAA